MSGARLLGRLRRDVRGVTIVEFAMVLPVFLILVLGSMDLGHTLYMRAIVQGAVQKAARDSGLESGSQQAVEDAIDASVRSQILAIDNAATVNFSRQYFKSFGQAEDVREPFTDSDLPSTFHDDTCNNNEPYIDENNNGRWDTQGRDGQGGAKDTVLYTATVQYARLFPMAGLIGLAPNITVTATTTMNNQPYGDQAQDTTTPVRHCA